MSFCNSKTIDQVQQLYDVVLQKQPIIQPKPVSPSSSFIENLQGAVKFVFGEAESEAV